MKIQEFEHGGFNSQNEVERAKMRAFDTNAPIKQDGVLSDPRRVQLLALYDQADERGKLAMINCGAFHARYQGD